MKFLLSKGHVQNTLAEFRTNVLDQVIDLKKQVMGETLPQGPDVGRITRSMADMYGEDAKMEETKKEPTRKKRLIKNQEKEDDEDG